MAETQQAVKVEPVVEPSVMDILDELDMSSKMPSDGDDQIIPDPSLDSDAQQVSFELPDLEPDISGAGTFLPPTEPVPDKTAEMMQGIQTELQRLKNDQSNNDLTAQIKEIEDRVKSKYGEADPVVAKEFADVLDLVRKSVLPSLEIAQESAKLTYDTKIAALEKELSDLKSSVIKPSEDAPQQQARRTQEYVNMMEASNPNVAKVFHHPQFKTLLKQPVNPLDPTRTWDHALADIVQRRDTGGLIQFTDSFLSKYDKKAKVTVPTTSVQGSTRQGEFDVRKALSLLQQNIDGTIRLDPDKRRILTEAVRKAADKDPSILENFGG